ncbi:MAG: IclR family transcriptional regulator [Pseudomonadota bacterium]
MNDNETENGNVPTVLRGLVLLETMVSDGGSSTPTELNRKLGFAKPSIHRLCRTLEQEEFLVRDIDGRRLSPGPRAQRLATALLSSTDLRAARQAILTKLSEEIGETCNLSLPNIDGMLYWDRVETRWPLRIHLPIGSHVPLYCTASGKMYLSSLPKMYLDSYLNSTILERRARNTITDAAVLESHLAQIRQNGFSLDDEEFIDGMVALAVPIRDATGRFCATLSFHAPNQRVDLKTAKTYVDRLRRSAEGISQLMIGQISGPQDDLEL